jgi:two-component system, OmpR family, sensor histidine kinase KdpD
MSSRRAGELLRWLIAAGVLAGIVTAYRYFINANPTTVALTFLLLITIVAARWPLRFAIALSLASAACYSYYFLPPIGKFAIADPENWLALTVFLVVALISSRLSERAHREAAEAQLREREVELLLNLSRQLLRAENPGTLLCSLPDTVARIVGSEFTLLYLLQDDLIYFNPASASLDRITPDKLRELAVSLPMPMRSADEVRIPLLFGIHPRGLLIIRGVSLSSDTFSAIGGLVSIAIDRAQALEEAARSEAAKENERLRTLMIDSITHELRTPLTSIKGAATTLLAPAHVADSGRRELLAIIDEECDRLNKLVSEAVEMAQLDAQAVRMNFAPQDMSSLISRALESSPAIESAHPVSVNLPQLPKVRADATYIQKVFCNLLENAAKYSQRGSPISVAAERRNGHVAVSVADRGPGIDPRDMQFIFDRFYRGARHSSAPAGTGMGLAISRAIVEAHGGDITVSSQLGHGSVFTFSVPIAT